VWTLVQRAIRLDDPRITTIDPSRGEYWNDSSFCYEAALRKLCRLLSADLSILWCFTAPGCWVLADGAPVSVEWELDVPDEKILGFIRVWPWNNFISRSFDDADDFSEILVAGRPVTPATEISAVVRFPLSAECRIECLGKIVPPGWREELQMLRGRDRALQERYRKMYRMQAADNSASAVARKLAAQRVEYLEEGLGLV